MSDQYGSLPGCWTDRHRHRSDVTLDCAEQEARSSESRSLTDDERDVVFSDFAIRAATLYALAEIGMIRQARNEREQGLQRRLEEWLPGWGSPPDSN